MWTGIWIGFGIPIGLLLFAVALLLLVAIAHGVLRLTISIAMNAPAIIVLSAYLVGIAVFLALFSHLM
jgi:hypothetical protein